MGFPLIVGGFYKSADAPINAASERKWDKAD